MENTLYLIRLKYQEQRHGNKRATHLALCHLNNPEGMYATLLHLLKKTNYTGASGLVVKLYLREFRSRTQH